MIYIHCTVTYLLSRWKTFYIKIMKQLPLHRLLLSLALGFPHKINYMHQKGENETDLKITTTCCPAYVVSWW